jgi:hypothetical protein
VPNIKVERKPPQANDYFRFTVSPPNSPYSADVAREKDKPSLIMAAGGMNFGNVISDLPGDKRNQLISILSMEMARLGVEFRFHGEKNEFENLAVAAPIALVDGLTGYDLVQRVGMVIRALILIKLNTDSIVQLKVNIKYDSKS